MAFGNFTVVTVDPTGSGSDSNGGAFDGTVGGVDYVSGLNQQVIVYTDIVIGATTTQGTSLIRPFTANDRGNTIPIPAGGGFTGGRFQIRSVSAGVATFDRSLGTTGSTGGSGNLGGSLATVQKGIDVAWKDAGAVADAQVFVLGRRTYSITTALNTTSGVSPVGYACVLASFYTNGWPEIESGDQATIAVGAGAGIKGISVAMHGINLQHFTFDGAATSGTQGTKGIEFTSNYFMALWNCKAMNWSQEGILTGGATIGNNNISKCEVTGCGGTVSAVNVGFGVCASFMYIHKNVQTGFGNNAVSSITDLTNSIIANNTGSTSDGAQITYASSITFCTFYGNGRDAIRGAGVVYFPSIGTVVMNNALCKSGGKGLNAPTTPSATQAFIRMDYNGYYSNAGNYNQIAAGPHDVPISTNPFVSSDSDLAAETTPNYALNTTPGAGADWRNAAYIGPAGMTTSPSYADIGAVQHRDEPLGRRLSVVSGAGASSFTR